MDTYRCSRGLVGRLLQPSGRNSANVAGGGCFCQRFAAGEQLEFHGRCLARNVRHGGRLDGLHGRQRDFRSRRAQRLACASGRSDSALHFRPGTVSGKGRSGPRAAPRRRGENRPRRGALARCGFRQRISPSARRCRKARPNGSVRRPVTNRKPSVRRIG